MEPTNQIEHGTRHTSVLPQTPQSSGFLPALGAFASGFVLSCFSPTFYSRAGRRPVWEALLFFFVFVALGGAALTASLAVALQTGRAGVVAAFRDGDLPELSITAGKLTLHSEEPFVRDMGAGLIVIDTTGAYDESDLGPGLEDVSILLTETEWLAYEDGQVSRLVYDDLLGGAPFEFSAAMVLSWLNAFVLVFFLTCGPSWAVGWLIYISLVGLVIWGVATLIRRGTTFNQVLIAGLYAVVPATYVFGLALGLPSMLSLFLPWLVHGVFWIFGLVCILWPRGSDSLPALLGPRPLRPWRALVAVPFLVMLWVPTPFDQEPGWSVALWLTAAATAAALLGVSVYYVLHPTASDLVAARGQFLPSPPALQSAAAPVQVHLAEAGSAPQTAGARPAPAPIRASEIGVPTDPVKVWRIEKVAFLWIIILMPGTFVLATVNALRMGMKSRIWVYVGAGIAWALGIELLSYFTTLPWAAYFLLNSGVLYLVRKQTESDIFAFQLDNSGDRVEDASTFRGVLISLGATVAWLILGIGFSVVLGLIGISAR